jgi:molybdopterin-guanine dinucleotide biosynthesis protein A
MLSKARPSFSAVLLAGGRSTRMGRDKALLSVPGSDLLLWQRQLAVLDELQPAEIFWSGAPRPGLPEKVRVVLDEVEEAGPLGGISACLQVLRSELLLVLAIDLPRMNPHFLRSLLDRCSSSCGAVARNGGFFEPLAAVYPKALQVLAAKHLGQKRYVLQDFVREAARLELLRPFPLDENNGPLFKNLNSPADL